MQKFIQFLIPVWYDNEWSAYPSCPDSTDIENLYDGTTNKSMIDTGNVSDSFTITNSFKSNVSASYIFIHEFESETEFDPTGSFISGMGTLVATGSADENLYIVDSFSPGQNYSLAFVPTAENNTNEYSIKNIVYSKLFKVPMYDQDYSENYSFSNIPFKSVSHTKTIYPNYDLAQSSKLIKNISYTFSGLSEDEKNDFKEMFDDFGNSFQPFFMLKWDNDNFTVKQVILKNNINTSKDKFDLWSVKLNLIEIGAGG